MLVRCASNGVAGFSEHDVGFGNVSNGRLQNIDGYLFIAEILQAVDDGFQRALHVGANDQV